MAHKDKKHNSIFSHSHLLNIYLKSGIESCFKAWHPNPSPLFLHADFLFRVSWVSNIIAQNSNSLSCLKKKLQWRMKNMDVRWEYLIIFGSDNNWGHISFGCLLAQWEANKVKARRYYTYIFPPIPTLFLRGLSFVSHVLQYLFLHLFAITCSAVTFGLWVFSPRGIKRVPLEEVEGVLIMHFSRWTA